MELYHVLNRGVEKRSIFMTSDDYMRFVCSMHVFNDMQSFEFDQNDLPYKLLLHDLGRRRLHEREPLVTIHGWCLMKNHFHLLVSELVEDGIPMFTKKLVGGYAKYVNEKYKRSGSLFQGRTKKVHISNDAHFLHILNYIHLNPLDTTPEASTWRTRGVRGHQRALDHLFQYQWSSIHDYCNTEKRLGVTDTEFFSGVFPNYHVKFRRYLQDAELNEISEYRLE